MGCGSSKVYVVNDKFPGQGPECLELMQKLLFTDADINLMYNAFCEFDITGDGEVSLVEFLTILQIEETPITREIFDEMDGDGNDKKMDFSEFVLHIWYYCVQDKKKICEMAFDIFDVNDNGLLSEEEIKQMVSEIYGARGLHHDLQKIISKLDKNKDGQISRQEFQAATHLFPALLFPAYEIQTTFHQKIGGEAFWRDKALQAQGLLRKPEIQALFTSKKTVQKKERRKTQIAEYKKHKERAAKRASSPYGSRDDVEEGNEDDNGGDYGGGEEGEKRISPIASGDELPKRGSTDSTEGDRSRRKSTRQSDGGGGGRGSTRRRSSAANRGPTKR